MEDTSSPLRKSGGEDSFDFESDSDASFSGDDLSLSFRFNAGDEYLNALLLPRVVDYIQTHFKSSYGPAGEKSPIYFNGIGLGHRILSRLMQSLESKYTRNHTKMSHVKINKVFTANEVPINKPSRDNFADLTNEDIKIIIRKKMSTSLLTKFSKIMVSLYCQSGCKPHEIMNLLKNY